MLILYIAFNKTSVSLTLTLKKGLTYNFIKEVTFDKTSLQILDFTIFNMANLIKTIIEFLGQYLYKNPILTVGIEDETFNNNILFQFQVLANILSLKFEGVIKHEEI